MNITQLASGYWHIRHGEQWSQPPHWPCDEETLKAHAFQDPSEVFIRAAMAASRQERALLHED